MPGNRTRRTAAAVVDAACAVVLAYLLRHLTGVACAAGATRALRVGSPETLWKGAVPMALGAVGNVVYGLPVAILLVALADPVSSASPGKWVSGLRVRGRARDAWTRALVKSAPLLLALLAYASGSWELLCVSTVLGGTLVAGWFGAFFGRRRALHDAVAGTDIVRQSR